MTAAHAGRAHPGRAHAVGHIRVGAHAGRGACGSGRMRVRGSGSRGSRALQVEDLVQLVDDLHQIGLVHHDLVDVLVGVGVLVDEL
jgi:hypothetical protein